jgi:hypothetical protein
MAPSMVKVEFKLVFSRDNIAIHHSFTAVIQHFEREWLFLSLFQADSADTMSAPAFTYYSSGEPDPRPAPSCT